MSDNLLFSIDVDGTITKADFRKHALFARLDEACLDADRIAATQFIRRYYIEVMTSRGMNHHDHRTWFDMTVQAWVECGLTLDQINSIFSDNVDHIRPGFPQFIQWLKTREDRQVYVVINSYGIRPAIMALLKQEGVLDLIDEVYATPLIFHADGTVAGYDQDLLTTAEVKGSMTKLAMRRFNVSPENTIGIGDSSGDRNIAPLHRLLLAGGELQVTKYRHHFSDALIADSWDPVKEWVSHKFDIK